MYNEVAIYFFLVSFFKICKCQLSTNGQRFRNISTSEGNSVQTVFCCRNFEPIGKNNTCKVSVFRMCICQLPTNGQCFRNISTSSSGVNISVKTNFCCRNFEPIGTSNTCKVCEFGFTSNGSQCEPCPNGKYGEKCGETCTCHDSERCHHELGCIPHDKGNIVLGVSTTRTTIHDLTKDGFEGNNVIIFMISIAVIGVIVIIIWTVWRCRFKFLHSKKIKRRKKLIERRINLSNGLQVEAEVEVKETDRYTTYAVINERNMIMLES